LSWEINYYVQELEDTTLFSQNSCHSVAVNSFYTFIPKNIFTLKKVDPPGIIM
jgi:hypothetical protein